MPFKSTAKCKTRKLPQFFEPATAPNRLCCSVSCRPTSSVHEFAAVEGSLEVEPPRFHIGLLAMRITLQTMLMGVARRHGVAKNIVTCSSSTDLPCASLALEEGSPSLQCVGQESLGCPTSWLGLFQALLASICRRGLACKN